MLFHNQTVSHPVTEEKQKIHARPVASTLIILCCLIISASVPILSARPVNAALTPTLKPSTLAIDGANLAGCGHSTNSCSTTLSTTHTNDIIMVYTFESLDLQTSCTFTLSDTSGLIWNSRGGVSGRNDGTTGSNRDQNAEFWAQSPGLLSSDVITESILGCASVQYGGEYNGLYAIGVSGANFNSPFDPTNPQAVSSAGYSNTPSVSISTSNSNDMIIGVAQQSSFGTLTPGSGFTVILATGPGGAASEFAIVHSPLANSQVTFGDDTTWYWEEMADAIVSSGHHGHA
jgi:hypothetical protein